MSVSSFITKFFGFIKKLIKKVLPEVKQVVDVGIDIVEMIKGYVDNPAINVITALTKNKFDDTTVSFLRIYLPKLLAQLKGVSEALSDDEMREYIEFINSREEDAKAILTHGICSMINYHICDDLGSRGQAFITTEVVWQNGNKEAQNA